MNRKPVFGLVFFLLTFPFLATAQTSNSGLIKLEETSRQKGQINRIELNRAYEDEFTEDTLKWGAYYMWPYIVRVDSPKTVTVRLQSDFHAGDDPKMTVMLTQRSSFSKTFTNWNRKTGNSSSLSLQLTKPGEYMLYISPSEKKRTGKYRFVVVDGDDTVATQIMAAAGVGNGGAAAGASAVAAASFKEGKPANYPVLPDHPEVHALRSAYEEFTAATFKPAQTRTAAQPDAKGKGKGALFCDPASGTGSAEITFTPPANPKADYIKYARVHDVACGANNTGMIAYASGLYWIGGVSVEKDNLLPARSGAGAWVGPSGEAGFGAVMPDGVTFKLALMTEPSGVAMRRMDEALPTGEAPARVRLTIPGVGYIDGETQNLVFQPQTAGNLIAFDGSFKTSGPIKAYEIPSDKMNEVSEIALVYLFTAGKPDRAATAISLEGLTKIDTTVPTAMGPAGTYLFNGRLRPGVLPIAAEVQPAPGTLVKYAPDAAKCLAKPTIPIGWLAWAPECKTNPNARMQAWSVDGRYRLTFAKSKTQQTILEEFDPQRPGQAINEWRAASFSAEKVPTPRGAAELWRGDELAYRGPFKGLKPEGEGACGVPGEDGKTEPCTYADGERADAVYLARLEQKKLDEAFAQREVEYEMSRRAAAEARVRLAREEAERKRQLAAQREAERQANRQAKASGLLNAFLGASYGSMVAANTGGNSGLTSLLSTAMQQKTGGTSGNALTTMLGAAPQQQLGAGSSTNALQGTYNAMLKQTLGTSAETLLNNPVQAALEMKQKADQDKAKREAAASNTTSASIAPAMSGSAALRQQQNTPPAPPPPAQSNGQSSNNSAITVIGANGTYQTADGTYRVEAKFEGGNLQVPSPHLRGCAGRSDRKEPSVPFRELGTDGREPLQVRGTHDPQHAVP